MSFENKQSLTKTLLNNKPTVFYSLFSITVAMFLLINYTAFDNQINFEGVNFFELSGVVALISALGMCLLLVISLTIDGIMMSMEK